MLNVIKNRIKGFVSASDGSATIETVLMVPLFIIMLAITVDASLTFSNHTQVMRAVHDVNRQLSVGKLSSESEVIAEIQSQLLLLSPNATITALIDNGTITSNVSFPLTDILAFGNISSFEDYSLSVEAKNYIEY
ncbi:MAG: pilus assembly protein [Paracoccaceae bacterium]|jgi:Flp pilus assembly protein TadG|nr:pilus assembly protein [Paracoccaceae bacterium]